MLQLFHVHIYGGLNGLYNFEFSYFWSFYFSLFKYTLWFFFQKEINIKRWFIISLLSTTIDSYTIMMFIVNSITFSGSTVSFIFSSKVDIMLYIYLALILFSIIIEVLKISNTPIDLDEKHKNKYFMYFSFVKFMSVLLFVSYMIILAK
jgi:hypothetical protein